MAFKFVDRAQMSVSGAPGTGPISLATALNGYQSIYGPNGLSNGDTFRYLAVDPSGAWEIGIGTYSSTGNVVTRAPTTSSAPGNAAVTLSSNAAIACTFAAEDITTGSLSGLQDVNVTEGAAIDGYVLTWVNVDGKWEAVASTTGVITLAAMTDVDITSPANNEALLYQTSASKWENVALASVALTGAYSSLTGTPSIPTNSSFSLSGLGDVNVTEGSGINGYSLTWSNATSRWIATDVSGGGGGSLAIKNNGTTVVSAATSVNFVDATSVTASGDDVTVTLPTGGGGTPGTPPVVVQFDYATISGSAPSVTMGAAPTDGNLLVAIVYCDGTLPGTGSGWTSQAAQMTGLWYVQIFTKVAGASESTTQSPCTGGSAHYTVGIYEVSGQNASPLLYFGVPYNSATNTLAQTPVLPSAESTLFLMSLVAGTNQTYSVTPVFGQATLDVNLTSGAGAKAAFGHSDSHDAVYGMSGVLSTAAAFYSAFALITA